MSGRIEETLADCLERIESGDWSIREALEAHPELAEELEPLLSLAGELRALPRVTAPESLRTTKRPAFTRPEAASSVIDFQDTWRDRSGGRKLLRWSVPLVRLAAGMAVAFLLLGGSVAASAGSLPDEPLYPVKLAVESAQLALAPSAETRAELSLRFADRRLQEVQQAAEQGRVEAVRRGVALYEQRLGDAVRESQPSAASEGTSGGALQTTLDRQQEVLNRVLNQLPPQAQATVVQAFEAGQREAKAPAGAVSAAASQPSPTVGSQPSATAAPTAPALVAAPVTAAPTATSAPPRPTASATPASTLANAGKPREVEGAGRQPGADRATEPEDRKADIAQGSQKAAGASPAQPDDGSVGSATPGSAGILPAPGAAETAALPGADRAATASPGLTSAPTSPAQARSDRDKGSGDAAAASASATPERRRGDDARRTNSTPSPSATPSPQPSATPTAGTSPTAAPQPTAVRGSRDDEGRTGNPGGKPAGGDAGRQDREKDAGGSKDSPLPTVQPSQLEDALNFLRRVLHEDDSER